LSDTVYFALGSSKLTPGDLASLKTFAVKVKNANVTALTVTGYADSTGTEPNNHSLSIQRARSVAAELTKLGLTSVTVHVLGGGVSHTFANAALDRRATITS
jgi:outer membrane protein OmpA-like peptidoglycan-associated protein